MVFGMRHRVNITSVLETCDSMWCMSGDQIGGRGCHVAHILQLNWRDKGLPHAVYTIIGLSGHVVCPSGLGYSMLSVMMYYA